MMVWVLNALSRYHRLSIYKGLFKGANAMRGTSKLFLEDESAHLILSWVRAQDDVFWQKAMETVDATLLGLFPDKQKELAHLQARQAAVRRQMDRMHTRDKTFFHMYKDGLTFTSENAKKWVSYAIAAFMLSWYAKIEAQEVDFWWNPIQAVSEGENRDALNRALQGQGKRGTRPV